MITAQDIREKTFAKAFNGYNMTQVDEFLDELAAEITALTKENAAMTAKMRVLVEKVEEYRQTEDSMRLALLSAQKMSAQVENEAQTKADAIVAQARDTANRLTRHATEGIASEEAKLEEAKKATARFIEHMQLVCEKQLAFYEKLGRVQAFRSDAPAAEPAPEPEPEPAPAPEPAPEPAPVRSTREVEVDEAVKSIESSVEKAALEQPEEAVVVDTEIPEEEEEPTRRFGEEAPRKKRSFDDFHFGEDL